MDNPKGESFEQSLKCSTHFVPIKTDTTNGSQVNFQKSIGTSEKIILQHAATLNRQEYEHALREYTRIVAEQDRDCRSAPQLQSSQNEFLKITAPKTALKASLANCRLEGAIQDNCTNGQLYFEGTMRQHMIMQWFRNRQKAEPQVPSKAHTQKAASTNVCLPNESGTSQLSKVKLFVDDVTDLRAEQS